MHRTVYVGPGYSGNGDREPFYDPAYEARFRGLPFPERIEAVVRVYIDEALGLVSIEHDGTVGWDQLQFVKNVVFGDDACAIEVYPPERDVVNNLPMRHLWLLGDGDWWPDLMREGIAEPATLRERYFREAGQ